MVLDEATAFADPENEALIQKAFAKLMEGKTVLMIAHRLSTVKDVDSILVIEKGAVRERGTHDQLAAQGGLYARMWRDYLQAGRLESWKGGGGMIRKLQHVFALSEKGARDFVKAVVWCFLCNVGLMLPVGVVMATLQYLLETLETGGDPAAKVLVYTAGAAAVLALLFLLHWFQYASLYLATYQESAARRIALAETLRKLPLSFFGTRDLSDLTSTMIADCSSLDQMFSHYIPQLFASISPTVFIGVCMFCFDWQMALAVLWVLPAAVLLTAGSKKLQDAFGTRNILTKREVADAIQEDIEAIRDIQSCNRQEACLQELDRRTGGGGAELLSGPSSSPACSSAPPRPSCGSAWPPRCWWGAELLAGGELSFLYFLGFLFAAARLYDPLGLVLQNIAATFSAKLKIERMRAIQEQPVQTGVETCEPENFDIVFDHVKFAYRDGESVLEDVSFTARQGQVTALVGPSGGGKSTACKLAARFWDIQGGKITLGGIDISTVDPETLLKHYSFVFQDVVLFRDTILENIRLGRRGAHR